MKEPYHRLSRPQTPSFPVPDPANSFMEANSFQASFSFSPAR